MNNGIRESIDWMLDHASDQELQAIYMFALHLIQL